MVEPIYRVSSSSYLVLRKYIEVYGSKVIWFEYFSKVAYYTESSQEIVPASPPWVSGGLLVFPSTCQHSVQCP